ncbi:hypothetical protein OIDMADRAFT_56549 [Oidiodendron maius Zn]|uniref:Uncharacterized protein n=1 Tax=Oidiodendron maius (strain Zn) TaxID=913774 RepID=A0A0C3GTM8_OIDMZ|nr:hypothetical protein OIDMADRAFT_56549 [Oidiodendron maius Zn]
MVFGAPGLRSSRAAHSNSTDLHPIAHDWTEIFDVGYTAWEQRHSFPHSRNNICGWRGAPRKGKGPHVPVGNSISASGWLLEAGRDGSYFSGSTPAVDQLQIHFHQAAGSISTVDQLPMDHVISRQLLICIAPASGKRRWPAEAESSACSPRQPGGTSAGHVKHTAR